MQHRQQLARRVRMEGLRQPAPKQECCIVCCCKDQTDTTNTHTATRVQTAHTGHPAYTHTRLCSGNCECKVAGPLACKSISESLHYNGRGACRALATASTAEGPPPARPCGHCCCRPLQLPNPSLWHPHDEPTEESGKCRKHHHHHH